MSTDDVPRSPSEERVAAMLEALGAPPTADATKLLRDELVAEHGEDNVFDPRQLRERFDVLNEEGAFLNVRRKADGKPGKLCYKGSPRFYFDFMLEDTP